MNEDMSELINKISSMVNQNSNNADNSNNLNNKTPSGNSSISPEAISKMVEMLKSKTNNDNTGDSNNTSNLNSNLDVDTILKFKKIFEKMNSKDDPRSNLLLALKPYLKESRKQKVEQYIQYFNVSKILDEFGPIAGGDVHK